MSLERIFKALVSLGLSQTDANVYIHIATKGPAFARNIINDLSLNNRNTYRSLNNLQKKGIVKANDKYPSEFLALPFEDALNLLINLKTEQAQDIQRRKKELISIWKANST